MESLEERIGLRLEALYIVTGILKTSASMAQMLSKQANSKELDVVEDTLYERFPECENKLL